MSSSKEKKNFRVQGHIKSFRDLEVYNRTTLLSSKIHQIELPSNLKGRKLIDEELQKLKQISKFIPKLIAESYGDRYADRQKAYSKLEKSSQVISQLITKIDFILSLVTDKELKQTFLSLIKKYQIQGRKIINLKRAWIRIAEKFEKSKK